MARPTSSLPFESAGRAVTDRSLLQAAEDLDVQRRNAIEICASAGEVLFRLYAWTLCPWDPPGPAEALATFTSKVLRMLDEDIEPPRTLSELKTMPYDEYLQTGHWQEVRERELETCGHRCRLCNKQDGIDVHHRTYERRGEELAEDVLGLCRSCHGNFHRIHERPKTRQDRKLGAARRDQR